MSNLFVISFYCKPSICFANNLYVIGENGDHFCIQNPKKTVYRKYSMQLKKKLSLPTCVINV